MKKKQSSTNNVKTFLRVLRYLKIYRIHFALSLLFTAAAVALTLYLPILIGQAIDLAIGTGNVDFAGIADILLKIGISVALTALLQWIIGVLNNQMTFGIVRNIRHEAFVRIQQFPLSYIDSHRSGEIVSRVIRQKRFEKRGSVALRPLEL